MVRRRDVGSGGKLIAIACAIACCAPAAHGGGRRHRAARARPAKNLRARSAEPEPQRMLEEHLHVRRGDTLESLLATRGVGASEARPWLAAAATVYDLRRLRPRQGLTLRFDRATHELETVHYEMDDRTLLVLERTGNTIHAERAPLPYFVEVKGASTRIERGFREDASAAGVPEPVVSALADIFGWEVDPSIDLRPGDSFRVLYENTWQTGAPRPEPGNVVGAQVVAGRRAFTAVFFEDDDGHGAYYTPAGEPLSREFLRYPLDFTDITSEFSMLRRHPVLGFTRPHLGVDFAAPPGTPVRAVASGTVTGAGWAGELGRCVRLEHAEAVSSVYGHLSRVADRIAEGMRVERGQVIGYVGSSGLSTGPHLHFALDRDGEYVDPMTFTARRGTPVADGARRAFERVQLAVTRQLGSLPETERPLTVSLSSAAYRPE